MNENVCKAAIMTSLTDEDEISSNEDSESDDESVVKMSTIRI